MGPEEAKPDRVRRCVECPGTIGSPDGRVVDPI